MFNTNASLLPSIIFVLGVGRRQWDEQNSHASLHTEYAVDIKSSNVCRESVLSCIQEARKEIQLYNSC